jgi:hypothetical protein
LYRKRPPRIVNRTVPKIFAISVHTVNRFPLNTRGGLTIYLRQALLSLCHIYRTLCHMNYFTKIWNLIFKYLFVTLLHWKSKAILDHKVNGPPSMLIFLLDNLKEWMRPWLSLRRFNITWSPSLFLMGRCLHGFVNWSERFYNNFLFIWCLFVSWIWQCSLTSSPIFWLLLTYLLTLRRIRRISHQMHPDYTSGINNDRKSMLLHLWHANKPRLYEKNIFGYVASDMNTVLLRVSRFYNDIVS